MVARDDHGAQTPGPEWTFSTGGDNAPPSVVITYPTHADGTITDDPVTVTGTADDSGQIEGIWINGVKAEPTSANYATWQAVIPVSQGWTAADPDAENTITAAAVDEHGNFTGSADSRDGHLRRRARPGRGRQPEALPRGRARGGRRGHLHPPGRGRHEPEALRQGRQGRPGPAPSASTTPTAPCSPSRPAPRVSLSPTLPQSGLYTVRLLPAGAGTVVYKLSCSGKPPAVKLKDAGTLTSGADTGDAAFTAQAGSIAKISVSSKDFDPAITVLDPTGKTLTLSGYVAVRRQGGRQGAAPAGHGQALRDRRLHGARQLRQRRLGRLHAGGRRQGAEGGQA